MVYGFGFEALPKGGAFFVCGAEVYFAIDTPCLAHSSAPLRMTGHVRINVTLSGAEG